MQKKIIDKKKTGKEVEQCRHWRGESAPVCPGLIRILLARARMPECGVSEQRRSGNEEGERYRECGGAAVSWRDLEHKQSLELRWEHRA